MSLVQFRSEAPADLAHLVERHLAKVEVAGSNPVIRSKNGSVVQLVRMPPCHGGGRGFESHPSRHFFIGFDRAVRTAERYADLAHLVERHLAKVEVAGSSPVIRSNHSTRSLAVSMAP